MLAAGEKSAAAHEQRAWARTGNRGESGLEVRRSASFYHQGVAAKRARSVLCLALLGCELRGVRVEQHGDGGGLRWELRAAIAAAWPLERSQGDVTPVTLAPGLLRLVTKPVRTGSSPPTNTTGMVVVAALMAGTAKLLPTITATPRRTRSVASAGSRPKSSSAKRSSMATSLPSTNPAEARPSRNAATRGIEVAADELRRNTDHRHRRLLCARGEWPRHCSAAGRMMNSRRCMGPP